MTDNPEKRFYKKLTKLIETGAVKFDAEPREVIAWFKKMWQQYTHQSPITDEQIKEKAEESELTQDDHITEFLGENMFIKGAKWLRDLQPKTDDWVSVDERLLKLLVWYQGKSENYRRVTLLVNVLKDFNSLPPYPKTENNE